MRPLIIICEPKHLAKIEHGLKILSHPRLANESISVISVDAENNIDRDGIHIQILEKIRSQSWPPKSTGLPCVAATDAIYGAIGLKSFLKNRDVELIKLYARDIDKLNKQTTSSPQLLKILGSCELSIHSASAAMLSKWSHSVVDLRSINAWKIQFHSLDRNLGWISEFILREVVMTDANDLTEHFQPLCLGERTAICYNRDERGTPKSGEIIANLIHKKNQYKEIHSSPASAIEKLKYENVVVFEDGLWTGTEAIGILESLTGKRPGRAKTAPLTDISLLDSVDLTLAYAVATDYGLALMRRYARDNNFSRISFHSASEVCIAGPEILSKLDDPSYRPDELFKSGPEPLSLKPYLIDRARNELGAAKAEELEKFCTCIGRQLFDNYLSDQMNNLGWNSWPEDKRALSALGMHNLALAHVFSHSIPKASLPLLWGKGKINYNGKTINWTPLFPNS